MPKGRQLFKKTRENATELQKKSAPLCLKALGFNPKF